MNIEQEYENSPDKIAFIEELRAKLHKLHPLSGQPIDYVRWVPISQVQANDYNPNSVASRELGLLYKSISQDGYTQPVVTVFDPAINKFVIVDGFHRYFVCKQMKDIQDRNQGYLPIVVIDKDINDRMASTIRHNRARGEHALTGMSSMVFNMLQNGWSDSEICNELGMEAEEILKLKHITGFSKLFANAEYRKSWKTKEMIKIEQEFKNGQG